MGSFDLAGRLMVFHDPADADRWEQGFVIRKEPRSAALDAAKEGHVQRRGGCRRGQARTARNYRISARSAEVPKTGWGHSKGRVAGRASGNRKDFVGTGSCGRGQRSLLLDF